MPEPRLFHADDPDPAAKFRWPFVYLHRMAERMNEQIGRLHRWDSAPDLLSADQPMPVSPGQYPVTLYGVPALAVLALRWEVYGGRVALLDDPEGLAHAQNPQEWM